MAPALLCAKRIKHGHVGSVAPGVDQRACEVGIAVVRAISTEIDAVVPATDAQGNGREIAPAEQYRWAMPQED
jgi:hypothetical protein